MKRVRNRLAALLAAALLLGLAACTQTQEVNPPLDGALRQAEYPEMAPYPQDEMFLDDGDFDGDAYREAYDAWLDGQETLRDHPQNLGKDLQPFLRSSIPVFLSGEGQENRAYSPLNVYLALAMLAESTGGETRQQILDLLGPAGLDALRTQAADLWRANYCDDGRLTSILAASLWLADSLSYEAKTVDTLAEVYHASTFQGPMGSDAFNKTLQDWVNAQTGGLLEEQAAGLGFREETVLGLASTFRFQARWTDEFCESFNTSGKFQSPQGEVPCTFLNQADGRDYFWGEHFSAVAQNLLGSGAMWLILPEEGSTPEALLEESELYDFLAAGQSWELCKYLQVNLSLPKFDVSSDLDLLPGLDALGVTDVQNAEKADFSPILTGLDAALSQARHAVRVSVDEEGCTAAAFTVLAADATAAMVEEEEIDFILDRPFLFAIVNEDGLPLFVGVVNTPD